MPDIPCDEIQCVRASAIRMLAMREHSREELYRKLSNKCADATILQRVLDDLEQEGLQSNERFVEHYISLRVRKGYGPIRIRAELEERGIQSELIQLWLDDDTESWFERLQAIARQKYVSRDKLDKREQARRARFLHSRGYPESLIRRYLWD